MATILPGVSFKTVPPELLQFVLPEITSSFLETKSVKQPTLDDYRIRATTFCQWCLTSLVLWASDEELDLALVLFMDKLYFEGNGADAGSKLVAALKFFIPRFNRVGGGALPRTVRCLVSWGKLRPGHQRLPFPWIALMAVVGLLSSRGLVWEAFYLLVAFRTYIRPGVFAQMKVKQLISPATAGLLLLSRWTFNLYPVEDLMTGKTGLFDESLVWDAEEWAATMFAALVLNRNPEELLWQFDHAVMVLLFRNACRELGLASLHACLYSLRHGGASHDLNLKLRSVEEVKRRGHWRSDSSLRRYGKEGKISAELNKIQQNVKDYGQLVSLHLEAIFIHNVQFKSPQLNVLL